MEKREREALDRYLTTEPAWRTESETTMKLTRTTTEILDLIPSKESSYLGKIYEVLTEYSTQNEGNPNLTLEIEGRVKEVFRVYE